MSRKKLKNLDIKAQKRIYNNYILTDEKFKKETFLVSIVAVLTFLLMDEITLYKYLILSLILTLYITYTFNNSLKWYETTDNNPLKKQKELFKNLPYDQLTKEQKEEVLYEYKKSEAYNPFLNIIYIVIFFEIILMIIKGILNLEQLFIPLIFSMLYLIYDLQKMKNWYKKL